MKCAIQLNNIQSSVWYFLKYNDMDDNENGKWECMKLTNL